MQNNSNFPNNDYNNSIKDFNQQGQNSNKSGTLVKLGEYRAVICGSDGYRLA